MTIETIVKGCPICFSDVKGNDKYLFFCKNCNLLFRRADCNQNTNKEPKENLEKEVEESKPQVQEQKIEKKTDLDKISQLFQ